MDLTENLLIFGSAAVGAGLQEILYWYDIYKRLDFKKYDRLMRSRRYWVIVGTFILATGTVAVIWFSDGVQPKKRDVFIFGVSLPLLIKQLVRTRPKGITLGATDTGYFDVR